MKTTTILLLLISYQTFASGIEVHTISHTLPFTTPLFQDSHERPSARLVYGACDGVEPVYDRNCTLVLESDKPRESNDRLCFCDVTFRSSTVPMDAINYVYALDENTTVVQWGNHLRRFAIVHFRDCRVEYPKVNDDSKISFDLIRGYHNGTFDVVVQDNRKGTPCLKGKWCRMIFDMNGEVLEHSRNWIDEDDDIIEIVRTGEESRLVVDMSHSEAEKYVRVYKAYDNGLVKKLKKYPVGNLNASSKKITVSTTYDLVTVCTLNNTNLTCGQFDHSGVLKLETHFKPLNFSNLHSTKVFNRRGGGFVLLTLDCKATNECNSADDRYFTIRMYDATTKILKSATIGQLKCGDEFNLDKIHFRDNDAEEFYLSYVCDRRVDEGRVSVEVNFFTKRDLHGEMLVQRKWRNKKY